MEVGIGNSGVCLLIVSVLHSVHIRTHCKVIHYFDGKTTSYSKLCETLFHFLAHFLDIISEQTSHIKCYKYRIMPNKPSWSHMY